MQGKQAKIVSPIQERAILGYLATTRYPARDQVMFLLSMKAGLRAKEMASLTWAMVTDAQGQVAEVLHACGRTAVPWSRCGAAVVACRIRAVHSTSVVTRRVPPAPASFPHSGCRDPSKAIPATIESRTPGRTSVLRMRAPRSRPARHPDTPEPHTTSSPASSASV